MLGYAGAIAVAEGAFVVFTRIDCVLLGPLAGPTAAGQFDAVVRIATLLQYPGLAVAIALAPRFAGQVAAGTVLSWGGRSAACCSFRPPW